MAFIPHGARWYVAEIVERIRVRGDRRVVVHVNLCLIRADGPDEAFVKAERLGKAGEIRYRNLEGREVVADYVGLRDLHVVHDALEDGAELLFEEHVGLSPAAIRKLTRPREDLGVFAPVRPSRGPDYAAADVMRDAGAIVAASRGRRGPSRGTP